MISAHGALFISPLGPSPIKKPPIPSAAKLMIRNINTVLVIVIPIAPCLIYD
jgi:hypothetical protein